MSPVIWCCVTGNLVSYDIMESSCHQQRTLDFRPIGNKLLCCLFVHIVSVRLQSLWTPHQREAGALIMDMFRPVILPRSSPSLSRAWLEKSWQCMLCYSHYLILNKPEWHGRLPPLPFLLPPPLPSPPFPYGI